MILLPIVVPPAPEDLPSTQNTLMLCFLGVLGPMRRSYIFYLRATLNGFRTKRWPANNRITLRLFLFYQTSNIDIFSQMDLALEGKFQSMP